MRLKFCAVAAIKNSSCAPDGPRNLKRSNFRVRLRCANSTSTFLRSRRDCQYSVVFMMPRATSRASSWMLRAIFRYGVFGQHCAFKPHFSQSNILAR